MGNHRSQNGAASVVQLLEAAQSLLDEREPVLAVIQAHRACELAIAYCVAEASPEKKAAGIKTLPSQANLARSIRHAIGLDIKTEEFWTAYCESTEKRNGIVHGGESVTLADARQAIKVAKSLIAYLQSTETAGISESDEVSAEFAKALRSLLETRGLSQKELATRANVSEQAISRLLAGKHSPTLRTIGRIAKVLCCRADVRLIEESTTR